MNPAFASPAAGLRAAWARLSPRRFLPRFLPRFLRREDGTATVEFVIAVPIVLGLLFSSIDFGVVMLRQVFLDRAVDMAVREVRLGRVSGSDEGIIAFREQICANTFLITNCAASLAVEMREVDTFTWSGLNEPAQCVNRAEEITPMLEFSPHNGAQMLMLIRVCAVADPFISATGLVYGMPRDASGGFFLVSRGFWVNEPA